MNEKAQRNIEFRIDRDGVWHHEGVRIKRDALAKLFSDRALKVDENGLYWLQTPFEKYPVEVEDVPYVIVDYEAESGKLVFRTNMDEITDRPIEMRSTEKGEIPYVEVRDGLYARVNRSVYYNLIEAMGPEVFEKR